MLGEKRNVAFWTTPTEGARLTSSTTAMKSRLGSASIFGRISPDGTVREDPPGDGVLVTQLGDMSGVLTQTFAVASSPALAQPIAVVEATRARATRAERNVDIVPPFAPMGGKIVIELRTGAGSKLTIYEYIIKSQGCLSTAYIPVLESKDLMVFKAIFISSQNERFLI